MSVNSSSSDYLHPSLSSIDIQNMHCLTSKPSSFIFVSYNITNIVLLLPLSIFILHHGLQQWRSTSSAATMSHSHILTYHMVTMELIRVFGCTLCLCGIYSDNSTILIAGFFLFPFTWFGEIFFHILTCLERYLAVVHPITYLSLRRERGVRIRNICIGCAWLLCFAVLGLMVTAIVFIIVAFFFLVSSLIVMSFCSLSVLRVLIRSGPGEPTGRRESIDQSKLRAFYTIVTILGVLVIRLAWDIAWEVLYMSGGGSHCVMMTCDIWFDLPGSLVLPLLFLHREGKLVCRRSI